MHEFEQPQRWHDPAYMVRRLASRTAQVPDEAVSVALQTTGFEADCLRRLLLENAPALKTLARCHRTPAIAP